ncbi:hypothetical protein [Rosistilla carotiformis]|nr:hypothetical protein [Rosistilla carotiformis]
MPEGAPCLGNLQNHTLAWLQFLGKRASEFPLQRTRSAIESRAIGV